MRKGIAALDLNDFEIAFELPVGDAIQPLTPFPFAGGGEVVDKGVAQPVTGDGGFTEITCGLYQGTRRARDVIRALVGTGDRRGLELEAFFHAIQSCGNDGGHRQVGVHVSAGAARLQAGGFGRAGNDAKARGAVVYPPGGFDRSPKPSTRRL